MYIIELFGAVDVYLLKEDFHSLNLTDVLRCGTELPTHGLNFDPFYLLFELFLLEQ